MDRKVLITNAQGQQMNADVIMTFRLKNNNNKYIVYTFNEKDNENIKTYVSKIIEEDDEVIFESITDEKEWDMVREAIMNETLN